MTVNSHLLMHIIEQSDCGKILIDQQERVLLWNRWLEEKSQIKAERAKGSKLEDLFSEKLPMRLKRAISDALRGLSSVVSSAFTPHPFPLKHPFLDKLMFQRVSTRGFRDDQGAFHCLIEIIDVSHSTARQHLLQKQSAKYSHRASHDGLTGLANRALFTEYLGKTFLNAKRRRERFAVLCLDLDHFKEINDTLGHSAGDAVLCAVSRRLIKALRKSDVIARLGGDEFAVLVDKHEDPRHGAVIAEKIIECLDEPVIFENREIPVKTSIGIATYPECGSDPKELMRNADAALYRAKEEGRNHFHFYTPLMNQQARERMTMEKELMRALEDDEFVLYYQPKIDLKTHRVVGAEALLRWEHPDRGLVPPGMFLPLANETGLILPIGDWVLENALKQFSEWDATGYENLQLAINVSGRQFNETKVADLMSNLLSKTGINPAHIELELTEEVMINRNKENRKVLDGLREMGLHIAIDDFGTGYSSLSYLKDFPLDTLKIDRCFIERLSDNKRDAIITKSIISLAHDLGLKVVAEGVEEQEQLPLLRNLNCDEVQGYFFSRPVPAEQFQTYCRKINKKK